MKKISLFIPPASLPFSHSLAHSHASFPSSAVRQIKKPCIGVRGPRTSIENESLPVLPNCRSTVLLLFLASTTPLLSGAAEAAAVAAAAELPPSPPAATSWKFFTLGAVTRPPKSRVKAPADADQRGETLESVSAEPSLAAHLELHPAVDHRDDEE